MAALAGESHRRIVGPEQGAWIARTAREQDNVRAALRWFIEPDETDAAQRLAGGLGRFWLSRGYLESW